MTDNRYVVIMAGGKGERFWPQSRQKKPKQLLPIVGDEPLLVQTVNRVRSVVCEANILVITNAENADEVAQLCPMLPAGNVVAEPVGRDTAAAVGLATVLVKMRNAQASFAVLPSDHVIHDKDRFCKVLQHAFEVAESTDALITIGIEPIFPSTGYGYIQRGAECMRLEGLPVYKVQRFVEKPNLETATKYVASGEYFWNAGMFIWRAEVVAKALEKYVPGLWKGLDAISEKLSGGAPMNEVLEEHYAGLEKISIDYALMEKADNVMTLPAVFDWDDVGAWPALVRHIPADGQGNVLRGKAIVYDGKDNIVIGTSDHLVSVMGLSNCIIVHTDDATMVCPRDRAQDIKSLVREVSSDPRFSDLV
ncbi:MAG: mannose-1-phosphate guanylyltransferase [Opitutales bacterium]|nr:mannose-1-phosphate guanylyltransferase [Opitutales bacterium]